ncbi:MAG: glycosyltransferase family 2 protein [Gammaproteobacteria bacterium]|nr:glycosyltransferase family 2 protein [Gammaproteobacteria bacterium]
MQTLCIVIPVFNEADALVENLEHIIARIGQLDGVRLRLLLVNDGSDDNTVTVAQALCEKYPQLSLLSLNRNFGKEAAILAGLNHVKDDAVVVMDSDLQHPPELVAQMVALWKSGVQVVEARKISRPSQSVAYRLMASIFYSTFDTLTRMDLRNHSDFKLLDRAVIDAYCALPERGRFFRGLIHWMHFSAATVPFEEPQRERGHSKWGAAKLLSLSWQSVSSFTSLPLHLVTVMGLFTFLVSMTLGGKALYDKLSGQALDGFTTVILLLLIIGSVLMFSLGLVGSYVARIYDEIKARPVYLVDEKNSRLPDD